MRRKRKNSFTAGSVALDTAVDKDGWNPEIVRMVAKKGTEMSKFFSKSLRRFLRDEDGPTAVEYAVMVSLIAAAVIASVGQVAVALKKSFNDTGAVVNPVLGQ